MTCIRQCMRHMTRARQCMREMTRIRQCACNVAHQRMAMVDSSETVYKAMRMQCSSSTYGHGR
eukprot:1142986-Pelagomonas_calceolata.AAC.4